MVATYRIYFRDLCGWIEACEDFAADSDDEALAIAALLFDACADCCAQHDLYSGKRLVFKNRDADTPNDLRATLTKKTRLSFLKTAETIRRGSWRISESKRLAEGIARLKKSERQDPPAAISDQSSWPIALGL